MSRQILINHSRSALDGACARGGAVGVAPIGPGARRDLGFRTTSREHKSQAFQVYCRARGIARVRRGRRPARTRGRKPLRCYLRAPTGTPVDLAAADAAGQNIPFWERHLSRSRSYALEAMVSSKALDGACVR